MKRYAYLVVLFNRQTKQTKKERHTFSYGDYNTDNMKNT